MLHVHYPQHNLKFLETLTRKGLLEHLHYCCYLVTKLCPTLLPSHGLQPASLLCPLDFPGKNTGHFLLRTGFYYHGVKNIMEKNQQEKNECYIDYPFINQLHTFMVWLNYHRVYAVDFESVTYTACNLEVQGRIQL